MVLSESKQILEDNGYEIAKADMNWRRSPRRIDRNDEIITVDHIDKDNYEDYIGKTVNVKGDVLLINRDLDELPIKFNKVGGFFNCSCNNLTSLEGCPVYVGSYFDFSGNKLTTLEGCPKYVGGSFDCSDNRLTSLEGCPETIERDFICEHNELTSLKGCPETVGGHFACRHNRLTSLEGCPKAVGRNFYCYANKIQFTEKEVEKLCDVKGIKYII